MFSGIQNLLRFKRLTVEIVLYLLLSLVEQTPVDVVYET
jgi:hypothetical protein